MPIPLRILRAIASTHQPPPRLSPRQSEQRALILASGRDMLAHGGRMEVSFPLIAASLHTTTATLRRHFACMDELLHIILSDHLDALFTAIEAVPETAPNLHTTRRAAYRAAMQGQDGQLLPGHHLLLTQTVNLPYDLQQDIAEQTAAMGEMLAPGHGKFALMLLDAADIALSDAEQCIALKTGRPAPAPLQPRSSQPSAKPPQPEPPQPKPAPPRPMVAVPRTLAGPAVMHPLVPEESAKSELWASTALQHQHLTMRHPRAGP